jgi:hypothetical protein
MNISQHNLQQGAAQFVFCVHHGDSTTGFGAFSGNLFCSDCNFAMEINHE